MKRIKSRDKWADKIHYDEFGLNKIVSLSEIIFDISKKCLIYEKKGKNYLKKSRLAGKEREIPTGRTVHFPLIFVILVQI